MKPASTEAQWDFGHCCCYFKNSFIRAFLPLLDLYCFAWVFSSCGRQGLLFVVVHGLLTAGASLVVEHRLSSRGARG